MQTGRRAGGKESKQRGRPAERPATRQRAKRPAVVLNDNRGHGCTARKGAGGTAEESRTERVSEPKAEHETPSLGLATRGCKIP